MKSGVGIAPPEHFHSTAVVTSAPIVPPHSTHQCQSNVIATKKLAAIPDQDNTRSDTNDEDDDHDNECQSGNTNLALAVFGCLWESLIVFANDWMHFGV